MAEIPSLSQLKVVDLREAWAHEAHNFTPWLAENIDQLSEAVGIPLEVEGTEVSVESFSADILARNTMDDSIVLIENQLEGSDHTHLGQIMTYLAGLEAQTIIWVAKDFREPHLAALNWLNDHTDERFAFFAVKIKVAQIANSPLAPIFDVVERPNNWERAVHAKTAQREGNSKLTQNRYEFWTAYVDRVDGERERTGDAGKSSNRWRVLEELGFIISLYAAKDGVGAFIRGLPRANGAEVRETLIPHEAALTEKLGNRIGDGTDHFFQSWKPGDYTDKDQRDQLIDWLAGKAELYEQVLSELY
ncbi:hypothetical protein COB72_00440 [bacterium]|nr:MAG: hypothetical protein COB72_00440 [bacterium]